MKQRENRWKPITVNKDRTIEVLNKIFNTTEKEKFDEDGLNTEWVRESTIKIETYNWINQIQHPFSHSYDITIQIPTKFIQIYSITELCDIIFHYIAHMRFKLHTPAWKKFMRKSGYDDTVICDLYNRLNKYIYCCSNENCGCETKKMVNKIKKSEARTCRYCGSEWDYFQNKP